MSTAIAAGGDHRKQKAHIIAMTNETEHKKVFFILHIFTNVIRFN